MIFFVAFGCVAGAVANCHPQTFTDTSILRQNIFVQSELWTEEQVAGRHPKINRENPEEMGNYVEGDMVIPRVRRGRTATTRQTARWPNGIIPFEIHGGFGNT